MTWTVPITRTSQLLLAATAGAVVWLAFVLWHHPFPFAASWAAALLVLGPLVLVPLGLRLVPLCEEMAWLVRVILWLQVPAALILALSFFWESGIVAGMLSLPWLITTGLIALLGILQIAKDRLGPVADLTGNMALVYLVIGGSWTALSRFGMRPLNFEAVIVLLTGIHFHYAGFVLPILAAMAARQSNDALARLACFGTVASVPLVATGITTTQLGYSPLVECIAAWLMALSGLLVALLHLRLALEKRRPAHVRILWTVAALSLAFGMVLAALYGSRGIAEMSWLDIPWMRALHGTANALGFAIAGLAGWNLLRGSEADF